MESDWRWNVYECGLMGGWTGLCARLLDYPDFWTIDHLDTYGDGPFYAYMPTGKYVYDTFYTLLVNPVYPSFPYGEYEVEPDH